MSSTVTLSRDSNQALGIGQFAIDFMSGKLGAGPSEKVLERIANWRTIVPDIGWRMRSRTERSFCSP